MAFTRVLAWAVFALLVAGIHVEGLGVNWGTQAAQILDPSVVIQMLKNNKIKRIKLFDSDHWTVKKFAGTGIEVMVAIPNNQLKEFSKDYDHVKNYVRKNITTHLYDGGVSIKYVAVGNEPFLSSYHGDYVKTTFPALKNVQRALDEAGIGDKIKATIPQNADVYDSVSGVPSQGNFRSDIHQLMTEIVHFFQENKCPFVVNIYPFLSLHHTEGFPLEFAFFDSHAKLVRDKDISYTNMFDANLDTLVWSLKKAGAPNVKIIVGEIGWPTDGTIVANVTMAKRFYDGFFRKMATKKGTPLYPDNIEYYLFSLTDENMKSIEPGPFERHWGIFRYDGKPKFPMDFTGQGNDKMPIGAKGVNYVASKWCILQPDADMSLVPPNMDYACAHADCTAMFYGSTCNDLDSRGNVSYAFNMYFQMNNQDVEACVFQGVAQIVTDNPSTKQCLFPLALESDARRIWVDTGLRVVAGLFMVLSVLL